MKRALPSQSRSFSSKSSIYSGVYSDSDDEEHYTPRPRKTVHVHTITSASATDAPQTSVTSIPVAASPQKHSTPAIPLLSNDLPPNIAFEAEDFMLPKFLHSWDEEHGLHQGHRFRTASDYPMKQWLENDRQHFLQEFLRMEGNLSPHDPTCPRCHTRPHQYRCLICFGDLSLCTECIVEAHRINPLHFIEKWNGIFHERMNLKRLGLRIQLNHPSHEQCFNPKKAFNDDFIIIDSLGIHEVGLDFCECEHAPSHSTQLLRARLYPATGLYPKTAATYQVLRQFHLLSFESKCSGYEFYNSLERLTNNTGDPGRDCYDEFMRMARQWRHLKMLKRTGRGHDPEGIIATKHGQWLYALYLGIDANFRMTRKHVSSEERDPSLGPGWAFFVEEASYKKYLAENWNTKQERSTCVSHDAVDKPDREARGLAATGIGTIDCARHNFKRPNGVGDLQVSERYINMDFLFFSSIQFLAIVALIVSYDIVCQWHKNLFERMMSFPQEMRLKSNIKNISFLVPKFHLPAHIEKCNLQFSFNLTKGVGRTDGEAPERGWANINPIAQSTKEMGPGSRHDTIDDHFNDWNWKKTVSFGVRMLSKIQEAVPACLEHRDVLDHFEASIPPEVIKEWTTSVENWESDASRPNPFKPTVKRTSEKTARLQLASEAAEEIVDDIAYTNASHPSVMIANGLQIEEEQRRLASDTDNLGLHPTAKQLSTLLERSNTLRRKISNWIEEQNIHMPQATQERAKRIQVSPEGTKSTKASDIPLFLPSAFPNMAGIDKRLRGYEWTLREGQAYDALEEIRHVLRLRSHMYKHKDRNSRGIKANTRSNMAITGATERINRSAAKYRAARAALVRLAPGLELERPMWEHALRMLEPSDIRALSEGLYGDSEGKRSPSWIWMTYGVLPADVDDDASLNEALRIEWCRTRARAMRWAEEVELLQEEMRRILAFLDWQATWWEAQCAEAMTTGLDSVTIAGMVAYAHRQAAVRRGIRDSFQYSWRNVPRFVHLAIDEEGGIDSLVVTL